MKKLFYFLIALCAILVVSCTNDNEPMVNEPTEAVPAFQTDFNPILLSLEAIELRSGTLVFESREQLDEIIESLPRLYRHNSLLLCFWHISHQECATFPDRHNMLESFGKNGRVTENH
jgi:hypothetical protein